MTRQPNRLSELLLPRAELLIDLQLCREIDHRTEWLARRLGVVGGRGMQIRRFRRGEFGLLTSMAYPGAQIDELVLCNDFNTYLFYVDDQAEEDESYGKRPELLEEYFKGHIRALRTGLAAWDEDPGTRLLQSIRTRLLQRASSAWLERFSSDLEDYLLRGTLVGARHWTSGTVPTPPAYMAQRAWDSAVYCSQDLAEAVCGGVLSGAVRGDPEFQETRSLVTRVVAFTNDLVSYAKEVQRHASPNNLVHVLSVHQRLNLEEAIRAVIEVVNRDVVAFESLAGALDARHDSAQLRAYQACQRAWMAGNLEWSLRSGRYIDAASPFEELRPSEHGRAAG